MASQVHGLIKNDLEMILYHNAVEVMAKERCPVEWGCFINISDFRNFVQAIQVRRVESDGECSMSSQVMVDSDIVEHGSSFSTEARIENKCSRIHHNHRIRLSVQEDFKIRVDYCEQAQCGGGGFEFVTGAAKGAVVGAGIGSIVPVAGTIVESVLGGIIGAKLVLKSLPELKRMCVPIEAIEIFGKFEDYSQSEGMCHCTVVGDTVCPYQGFKAMSGSEPGDVQLRNVAQNRTTEYVV